MAGELILLPNLLSEESKLNETLPEGLKEILLSLDGFIVENAKSARRFISRFSKELLKLPMEELNKHDQDVADLLPLMERGEKWGILSECGLPCIADPGTKLVELARKKEINIRAIPGPSSIFLALMLSGLSGQSFAFHGYLPKRRPALDERIKLLVERSKDEGTTHLFIETPYRNNQLFSTLLELLPNQMLLSIASDLTSPQEFVKTMMVSRWKKSEAPDLHKRPTIFLFNST